MLLRSDVLSGIRDGRVSLAFRRWRRPMVRAGGSLLTAVGRLGIKSVGLTSEADITEQDAVRAGSGSREELLRELNRRPEGDLYRVEFGAIAADERVELRAAVPDAAETHALLGRLTRFDESSATGPWTRAALQLISEQPGFRAEALRGPGQGGVQGERPETEGPRPDDQSGDRLPALTTGRGCAGCLERQALRLDSGVPRSGERWRVCSGGTAGAKAGG